jgi:hypothetical protein
MNQQRSASFFREDRRLPCPIARNQQRSASNKRCSHVFGGAAVKPQPLRPRGGRGSMGYCSGLLFDCFRIDSGRLLHCSCCSAPRRFSPMIPTSPVLSRRICLPPRPLYFHCCLQCRRSFSLHCTQRAGAATCRISWLNTGISRQSDEGIRQHDGLRSASHCQELHIYFKYSRPCGGLPQAYGRAGPSAFTIASNRRSQRR